MTVRLLPIRSSRDGGPARPPAYNTSSVPTIVIASSSCEGLARDQSSQRRLKVAQPGSPPISSSNSAVFSCISASFARLSTFSRISGSVFDNRRLNRQSANSKLTPSVSSTDSAAGAYFARTAAMVAWGSATAD